jgi:SAM-dependent methyltransferase
VDARPVPFFKCFGLFLFALFLRNCNVIRDNSDVSWVQLGNEDPYFGVLSDERFRLENLNDEHEREFFETGQVHVKRVLRIALDRCGAIASQKSALDFGCGVGRLVIPFASVFEHVTGVDVSPAMLRVAEENCLQRGIRNVDFLVSDDNLTRVVGKFDFIHCYLVLQHIPTRRGERIIACGGSVSSDRFFGFLGEEIVQLVVVVAVEM